VKKNTKLQMLFLCLVPLIMVLGNSMLIPVLPEIKKNVHINQFQVGILITAFSVPAGIVIPFAGILSDQIGRKKVMAPALILYGAGGIVAGIASVILSKPYWGIFAGRIIQGIGAGGTYQLAMAMVGDIFKSQERVYALGLLEASNGLGKVISPILGASLALITWYTPFFAYGLLAIPIGISIYIFVKEKQNFDKQKLQDYVDAVKDIFKQKWAPLLSSFFAGMVALFSLFGILSLYSDILEKRFSIYGFMKGLVMAGPVFIMAAISFSLGIWLEKSGNKGLKYYILTGVALIVGGQALFILTKGFWPLFISLCLLGSGVGLVMTPVNTLVTSSCNIKRRGIITCLYGSVRFFGVAIGPPLYGLSEAYGIPLVVGLAGSASVVAFILSLLFIDQQRLMSTN
jgi:ACDE family multidrug resistance protein